MAELYATLLLLVPLAGFAINGLGFRIIPKTLAGIVGVVACLASFGFALGLFSEFLSGSSRPIQIHLFDWITVASTYRLSFSLLIDQLTLVMLMVITGVGSLIHIYSAGYMSHDEGFGKFFAFLNLFVFSMLMLVLGGNYLVMFAGWEGVGLCSFLLIGFWNKNKSYNLAARKAFVMNRIGDLGFLLAMFMILNRFGTLDFMQVFAAAPQVFAENDWELVAIVLLLFVGAMGKSAQIPLFTWLPDAMAGPTPVSALIHAATMVTAGIYMVFRSNALYSLAPDALEVVAAIGCATALVGAVIGTMQNDIKKILAYSTVSQLGYMFVALGAGAYVAALFHVVTHAFFKALLFLGAGSVIHGMTNEQDIRRMGGLSKYMPLTYWTFLAGTVAISGIPPLSGFFSKDEILLNTFLDNKLIWALMLIGSGITAFYMFRLVFLTFHGSFRGTEEERHHIHESPVSMTGPLVVLAILSVIGGVLNIPHALGGNSALASFLAPVIASGGHHEVDASLELGLMAVSVLVAIVGIGIAYAMYRNGKSVPGSDEAIERATLGRVVYNKLYVDEIYDGLVVKPVNFLSRFLHVVVDFLFIDLIVQGVARGVQLLGRGLRYIQAGGIHIYMFIMVVSIAMILYFAFISHILPV